jgi:hypothetical protein
MKKRTRFVFMLMLAAILGLSTGVFAATYNLSLEATTDGSTVAASYDAGDDIYLNIVLDNAAGIAGVAFTLTYDAAKLDYPATDAEGLPVNAGDITSLFPFTYTGTDPDTDTYRANSSVAGKIHLAGAEIDGTDGGGKYGSVQVVLFTVKFTAKAAAAGTATFGLVPTILTNLDAGYDNEAVALLVSAVSSGDPAWGGDLSDDFTDQTTNTALPQNLDIEIIPPCTDSDSDGLCDEVETNTGVYVDPTNTGTDPNNSDSDGDGLLDGEEIAFGSNPNMFDTDRDGYSDLVEQQNGTDPNVQDPPDGSGYDPATDNRVFNLDIDGNGSVSALQDGLVIIRYLFGSRGATLIANVVDPAGTRTTAPEVEAYIGNGVSSMVLDIDGNGSVSALQDGLVIIRYLFGSRGATLIANVVDPAGTRTTAPEVEAYIQQLIP